MGRRGAELLLAKINGDPGERLSSERPRLVVRESAGPPTA